VGQFEGNRSPGAKARAHFAAFYCPAKSRALVTRPLELSFSAGSIAVPLFSTGIEQHRMGSIPLRGYKALFVFRVFAAPFDYAQCRVEAVPFQKGASEVVFWGKPLDVDLGDEVLFLDGRADVFRFDDGR